MARGDAEWVQDILSAIARDGIVHEYFRINTRRIWDVVTGDIDARDDALRGC
ncbi:MAG TPA: HepT-like ribonuclease domain-containing protein [Rhodopila sp.]|nr:HepT-like ribonuclease domain-containing protein [Rhodopila sp.]